MQDKKKVFVLSFFRPSTGTSPVTLPWFFKVLYWLLIRFKLNPQSLDQALLENRQSSFCLLVDVSTWRKMRPVHRNWLTRHGLLPAIVAKPSHIRGRKLPTAAEIREIGTAVFIEPESDQKLTAMSASQQEQILAKCSRTLDRHFPQARKGFVYPQGAYDTSVLNYLREFEFHFGVNGQAGVNEASKDLLQLKTLPLQMGFFRILFTVVRLAIFSQQQGDTNPKATPLTTEGIT